jgi:hypothetical protein
MDGWSSWSLWIEWLGAKAEDDFKYATDIRHIAATDDVDILMATDGGYWCYRWFGKLITDDDDSWLNNEDDAENLVLSHIFNTVTTDALSTWLMFTLYRIDIILSEEERIKKRMTRKERENK